MTSLRCATLLVTALSIVLAMSLNVTQLTEQANAEWDKFKNEHGKNYAGEEDAKRKDLFVKNFIQIAEHNEKFKAGKVTYEMGINQFSDWTEEEFKKMAGGVRPPHNK